MRMAVSSTTRQMSREADCTAEAGLETALSHEQLGWKDTSAFTKYTVSLQGETVKFSVQEH